GLRDESIESELVGRREADQVVRPVVSEYREDSFFFSSRRRHTRFDCDWSSDVCSSDLAAAALRDGGAIHYFAGGGGDALPIPLETLYKRELTVTATYSSSPADLAAAFALVVGGEVSTEPLLSHRLPLDRVDEGVALMRRQ